MIGNFLTFRLCIRNPCIKHRWCYLLSSRQIESFIQRGENHNIHSSEEIKKRYGTVQQTIHSVSTKSNTHTHIYTDTARAREHTAIDFIRVFIDTTGNNTISEKSKELNHGVKNKKRQRRQKQESKYYRSRSIPGHTHRTHGIKTILKRW